MFFFFLVKWNDTNSLTVTEHICSWKGVNASFASGDASWCGNELNCTFYVPWATSDYCTATGLNEHLVLTVDGSKSNAASGTFQRDMEGCLGASGSFEPAPTLLPPTTTPAAAGVDDVHTCISCQQSCTAKPLLGYSLKEVRMECSHIMCVACVTSATGCKKENGHVGKCPVCDAPVPLATVVFVDDGSAIWAENK